MHDLFVNLLRYRPRESLTPKENFFTEILAFLFKQNKKLLEDFLKKVLEIDQIQAASIKTQSPHKDPKIGTWRYIDLEIELDSLRTIFIENKIESALYQYEEEIENRTDKHSQAENDLDILKAKVAEDSNFKGYMVLLTKYGEDLSERIRNDALFQHIFWSEVYCLFKEYNEKTNQNEVSRFLICNLLRLLEAENMNPYEGLSQEQINSFDRFIENIKKLFSHIIEEFRKDYEKIRRGKLTVSGQGIEQGFRYKNVDFSLRYASKDSALKLYIAKKDLKNASERNFADQEDYYESSRFSYWKTLVLKDNIWELDAKRQLKAILGYYKMEFKRMTDIIDRP